MSKPGPVKERRLLEANPVSTLECTTRQHISHNDRDAAKHNVEERLCKPEPTREERACLAKERTVEDARTCTHFHNAPMGFRMVVIKEALPLCLNDDDDWDSLIFAEPQEILLSSGLVHDYENFNRH